MGTPHHVASTLRDVVCRPSRVARHICGAALPLARRKLPSLRHFPHPQVRNWTEDDFNGTVKISHNEESSERTPGTRP